jgi:mono/diheme cytochrome c family protein
VKHSIKIAESTGRAWRTALTTPLLLIAPALIVGWLAAANCLAAEIAQSPDQRKLFIKGAQLWPVYCAQCHNARPGSQFSPAQWDLITMHMRTQSIMPPQDMRAIKEFLKTAR